jgi:mono/diheme cytochrome c family protein
MTFLRRHAVPLAAALAAAAVAFAALVVATDDGGSARVVEDGLAVFNRMGCGGCHQLQAAGSTGPIGPSLDERLPDHSRESLRAVILSPPPESVMPQGFGGRMSDRELDALVDFLLAAR